jgi:hypothetical protein
MDFQFKVDLGICVWRDSSSNRVIAPGRQVRWVDPHELQLVCNLGNANYDYAAVPPVGHSEEGSGNFSQEMPITSGSRTFELNPMKLMLERNYLLEFLVRHPGSFREVTCRLDGAWRLRCMTRNQAANVELVDLDVEHVDADERHRT